MNKVYNGFSKAAGVYQIINTVNGDIYIGSTGRLCKRAYEHESQLNKNTHCNPHLQAAWNHYGPDAFEFTVLGVYPDKVERLAAEQVLIDKFYGDNCYNAKPTAFPAPGTWSHDKDKTKKQMRESRKKYMDEMRNIPEKWDAVQKSMLNALAIKNDNLKIHILYDKDENKVVIQNVSKWCKERGYSSGLMAQLLNDKPHRGKLRKSLYGLTKFRRA